jgi:thioredoxin reductase
MIKNLDKQEKNQKLTTKYLSVILFDWDAVIIGGGPAGLTVGLYLCRIKRRTKLLDKDDARDIRSGSVRQVVVAVGDSAIAAITADKLLQEVG